MSIFDELSKIQPIIITGVITSSVMVLTKIFRVPISQLIERLTKVNVQRKNSQSETIVAIEAESGMNAEQKIVNEIANNPKNILIGEEVISISEDKTNNFFDVWIQLYKGNSDNAKKIFEELLKNETEEENRFTLKLNYFSGLFYFGFDNDLKNMNILVKENDCINKNLSRIYQEIGKGYLKYLNYEKVIEYSRKAIEISQDESVNINAIINISEALKMKNKYKESLDELIKAIKKYSNKESLSKLYYKIFDIMNIFDKERSIFALKKAQELDPGNTDYLFKLGYNTENPILSAYYYGILIKYEPKNSTALNNLGVCYEKLLMNINSISNYKKAKELKETLAASNIALKLLQSGFIEEAKENIAWAIKQENVNENVHNTSYAIEEANKKEDEKKEIVTQNAIIISEFYSRNADIFIGIQDSTNISGVYKSYENSYRIEIKCIESKYLLSFENGVNVFLGSILDFYKRQPIKLDKKTETFILDKEINIYIAFSNDKADLVLIEDEKAINIELTREKNV